MLKTGISQIGGKFRLRKELVQNTPYHEFFLSMFTGSGIYEINKPRCRYECWNDKNAEIINYFLMVREHPKEFDEMKRGVFGLVSQEICNRIVQGKLVPKNDLERAYFFYYLNKLSFGGDFEVKGFAGMNQNRAIPQTTFHKEDIEEIKAHYCGIMRPTDPIRQPQVDKIKANFKGLQGDGFQVRKTDVKRAKAQYRGITVSGFQSKVEKARASYRSISPKASYKGISPKTTRPYTNNDCGVLTPLDPMALKRMRYVNLTSYDFTKVYDLFYKAFYERKELTRECFIYCSEGNNLVRMFNEELKPIKDIKKNDLVFGNKRVLETFKRQYNGEIYSLKICGIPSYPLNITPEHPILAIKKKDVLCKRKEKKQICYRSFSNEPKKYCNNQNCDKIIEFKPQFYKTQDLEVDDLVLIPTIGNINDIITQKINEIPLKKGEFKNFNHEIKWNKDLFRLFGYYLAEGHIEFLKGISYGIGFSFHKKEREYINEVKNLMKKIFNIEGKETKCNSPNVIQIKFNSKPISNFIIKYCNYHSYEKKCSTDIMTTHPKLQLEMFKTWINGDGQLYKRKSNKKNISLIGTTTSKKLALQMYLVLLRNNIIGSIKKRGKIENYSYKILGRKIEKRHQIYDVMVRSNQELNKIGYNVGKQRSKLRRKLFNEKYILSPIMNIKKEIKETTVYNIYCEDHQYPLNFIMNHNCDPPYPGTEKYYGKKFDPEFHHSLIDRMIKTPFHFMLSIGGECEELYVEPLKDEGWNVKDVYTRYSTDANSQDKIREYLIMNYDINLVPDIKVSNTPTLMKYIARK